MAFSRRTLLQSCSAAALGLGVSRQQERPSGSKPAYKALQTPSNLRGNPASAMQGIAWGFLTNYQFGYKGAPVDYSNIGKLADTLGHRPALIHSFFPWKKPDGSYRPFPRDFADYVRSKGALPLITWPPGQADVNNQVEDFRHNRPQPDFDTVAIASGLHDAYISDWADAAKAYRHTVYVRLMHEVLGTPYPHAYGQNRNADPAQYVAAFRHVVDFFHEKNVTNVQFVWCFGCGPKKPPFENFFPGDEYVQWVSLDGYNRLGQGRWRTFEEIFGEAYSVMTKISRRAVMIGEIASVEQPNDPNAKAAWIKDTFLNVIPSKMPRIKAVVFFNSGGHLAWNYHVDSSPASFEAYQAVIADPLYQACAPLDPLYYETPKTSLLTVNGGSGGGSYPPGTAVTIMAAAAPAGDAFDKWVVNRGDPRIADVNAASTSLKTPPQPGLLLVTAIYKRVTATYSLTVNNGCHGNGSYAAGAVVRIAAGKAPEGKLFDKWVIGAGNPSIADVNADCTTLTMPACNVTVTAVYKPAT